MTLSPAEIAIAMQTWTISYLTEAQLTKSQTGAIAQQIHDLILAELQ